MNNTIKTTNLISEIKKQLVKNNLNLNDKVRLFLIDLSPSNDQSLANLIDNYAWANEDNYNDFYQDDMDQALFNHNLSHYRQLRNAYIKIGKTIKALTANQDNFLIDVTNLDKPHFLTWRELLSIIIRNA